VDTLREATMFLLGEYIETTGAKYVGVVNHITDLKESDALRGILREESERLEEKLAKARSYLEALRSEKA